MMENKLSKLIKMVQNLPESCLEDAISYVEKLTGESDEDKSVPLCPHCKSEGKRNGHKDGIQRFKCKMCNKTYGMTTNTTLYNSRCGEAVWKQVIRDTVDGVSMDKTAEALALSHATVFNMRHRILLALEAEEMCKPTVLDGVCELDDTYVLESPKGTKIAEDYWRKPCKHGTVAQKRGLSNEYICISAGVQRDGAAYSQTVTRSSPEIDDLTNVFKEHIGNETLIVCDGAKTYNAFGERVGSVVLNKAASATL